MPQVLHAHAFVHAQLNSALPLSPAHRNSGRSMSRAPALGDEFPNFDADSTHGTLNWHTFLDGSWTVLFLHPTDFAPVGTTELGSVETLKDEFQRRGVKVAALSCATRESHEAWVKDVVAINQLPGPGLHYPIIADPSRRLACKLGMCTEAQQDAAEAPATCRAAFVVGPDKRLKLSLCYPTTTGLNLGEVLRVIDSLQLTTASDLATPANWKRGDKCMLQPSMSAENAKAKYPMGVEPAEVPSGKPYMRFTPDPR